MPDYSFEQKAGGTVVGLDEVGCGPWAGPVIAACFYVDIQKIPPYIKEHLNDSKKLSLKKREILYDLFQEQKGISCFFEWDLSSVEEIDTLNIRKAAFLAMERSFKKICAHIQPTHALIDGRGSPSLSIPTQSLIKGDSLSLSIAGASVIAKVERDRLMRNLSKDYPHYAWEKNAGYGTKAHQEGIAQFGITPHHRKSYAPIARYLAA